MLIKEEWYIYHNGISLFPKFYYLLFIKLKKYNEESTELLNLILKDKGNLEKRINRIRKNYSNKKNIHSSYEKMYSIKSKLNSQK